METKFEKSLKRKIEKYNEIISVLKNTIDGLQKDSTEYIDYSSRVYAFKRMVWDLKKLLKEYQKEIEVRENERN